MNISSQSDLAPIAVFAYRRPQHLYRTLESLAANPEARNSSLFIFCDGLRDEENVENVSEVRHIARSVQGFKYVEVIERATNWGLANNIIDGVTRLCAEYGKIIVVEDDLTLSPLFLKFMNEALRRYEDNDQVMQIAGYMFDCDLVIDEDTVLLPFISSWGWATWNRAWKHFDPEMRWAQEILGNSELRSKFNLNDNYPYTTMLQKQISGHIDSWAIRWYLSVFQKNGLALYPRYSLVINNGMDGSGVHCSAQPDAIIPQQMNREIAYWTEQIAASPRAPDIMHEIGKFSNKASTRHQNLIYKTLRYISSRLRGS